MADGGVMMGLPRSEALELAAQSESPSLSLSLSSRLCGLRGGKSACQDRTHSSFAATSDMSAHKRESDFLDGLETEQNPHSCSLALPPLTAMQGAARMVLQTGIHPAALKDSVTSSVLPSLKKGQ